ncbi:5'-3' exonuclease PLD3-like isoform X1 [Diorhabda sublineata]|uniref:5'-3' exonuclease PLD3-like isoform X1 n=1 Tax=Diorhabda sublineata TaxID=1163346 RepID=UPI0024E0FA4F|nr:5'-3' exonuclease PLD3-like isoform X1 [Diorhabda sublineata]
MPHFWDFGKSPPKERNLQDGLFQIASQTCNLLVQVNNTNNISYGNNSSNIHLNNISTGARSRTPSAAPGRSGDREQLLVLIPPNSERVHKYKPSGLLGKPRLSTVLETSPVQNEEDTDIWSHGFMIPSNGDDTPERWSNKNKWCRPSCIPISIICILIFLVVLLPLLDHATERNLEELNSFHADNCNNTCRLSLTESIPEGLIYSNGSIVYPSTFDTWLDLINSANESIDIGSLYWTLRQSEVYPDPSSLQGEKIFQSLVKAGVERGIKIRIAQNAPSQNFPNIDTELLVKRKAAEVRSLNFAKLLGSGVLHTKLWIVDKKHIYVGSANMDWRSLTQVKELGITIRNCSCLANDVQKIFEVYWTLGADNAKIPPQWPSNLSTQYNNDTPFNLMYDNETFQTYFTSSPLPFNPSGRTNDIDALTHVVLHAEKFVYISVMDYFPLMIYTPKVKFWPVIDDALKTAAIENKIKVKLLISWWNHSRPSEDNFLKSLSDINNAYPGVSLEIRRFIVPANKDQQKIPFARVNHNKYMVTDNTAFIGTSNWSGDYFTDTAGISFILHDPVFDRNTNHTTIRSQLQGVFERDWNSPYAHFMNFSEYEETY